MLAAVTILGLASLAACSPLEAAARNSTKDISQDTTKDTTCPTCVFVKSSSNTQSVFPWLFNNNNARRDEIKIFLCLSKNL